MTNPAENEILAEAERILREAQTAESEPGTPKALPGPLYARSSAALINIAATLKDFEQIEDHAQKATVATRAYQSTVLVRQAEAVSAYRESLKKDLVTILNLASIISQDPTMELVFKKILSIVSSDAMEDELIILSNQVLNGEPPRGSF